MFIMFANTSFTTFREAIKIPESLVLALIDHKYFRKLLLFNYFLPKMFTKHVTNVKYADLFNSFKSRSIHLIYLMIYIVIKS